MMSERVYVLGHKNPDTDSISSAITYANMKREEGMDAVAARCGEINPETSYVLDRFDMEAPQLVDEVSGNKVILVDHNEYSQAVDGARDAEIVGVLDHHRVGDVQTDGPINFHIEPIGSTSTIIAQRYMDKDIEMTEGIKGLLLSAILSDTVVFRSPTSTPKDEKIGRKLAKDLGLDVEEYGKEMFKAKSKLGEKGTREIVLGDFKEFEMGEDLIGIGQVETVTPEEVIERKDGILESMQNVVDDRDYTFLILLVTDLLNENSETLFVGEKSDVFESTFDVEIHKNSAFLEDVLSRKKQVVPPLREVLEN